MIEITSVQHYLCDILFVVLNQSKRPRKQKSGLLYHRWASEYSHNQCGETLGLEAEQAASR